MIYFQSLCYQWHKLAFFLLLCYDFGNEVIDMLKSTNLKRRDTYLNKLIGFQDTEPVKVITGIRRCGKSSLLKLMISHLIETGIQEDQILEMNFESFDFRKMSSEEVYNYVTKEENEKEEEELVEKSEEIYEILTNDIITNKEEETGLEVCKKENLKDHLF